MLLQEVITTEIAFQFKKTYVELLQNCTIVSDKNAMLETHFKCLFSS